MLKNFRAPIIVVFILLAVMLNGFSERGAYAIELSRPSFDPSDHHNPLTPDRFLEQQFMLKIEIQVASSESVEKLAALGFACPLLEACTLDIPRHQLKVFQNAGFEPKIVEHALVIRTPSEDQLIDPDEVTDEAFQNARNTRDYNIPDYDGGPTCGYKNSPIDITGAPANAVVKRVEYSLRVEHTWVTDLVLLLSNDQGTNHVLWEHDGDPGTGTDGDQDDDDADDRDIVLTLRRLGVAFDGDRVNQGWYLEANDCVAADTGFIDRFEIWVFYEMVDPVADIRVSPDSLSFYQSSDQANALASPVMANEPLVITEDERKANLDQVYQLLEEEQMVRVIVSLQSELPYTSPTILRQTTNFTESNDVLSRLNSQDFRLVRRFSLTPGFAGWVTRAGLDQLSRDPQVLTVHEDIQVHADLNQSRPLINAGAAHALGYTGQGITVAVLDTGIDRDHPDLNDDLVAQKCYTDRKCPPNNSDTSTNAEDGDGHGTSVSGIITSRGTVAPLGVAPDARIAAVKVLDDTGSGYMSDWIAGIDWAVSNRNTYNIKVINMSLGGNLHANNCDGSYSSATRAIDSAVANGITVFAASGNEGSTTRISAPACINNAVSVGAVYDANIGGVTFPGLCTDSSTRADKVTCYSNSNQILDLLAPGTQIRTTGLNGGVDPFFGGTSAATPHAAAVAALMLSANPTLDPQTLEARMKSSGKQVTDHRNDLVFPRINARAAIPVEGFRIYNDGGAALTINHFRALDASCWLDISPNRSTPFTIAPGNSVFIDVDINLCLPSGSYNDTIRINSDDPDQPRIDIPVTLDLIGYPGISVNPNTGLFSSENGDAATFNISLAAEPANRVTINLSSSDTGEGTVSPSSVSFLPANWNTPRTVTVTGQDDAFIDGDIPYTIIVSPAISNDPSYNDWDPEDVSVINRDNENDPFDFYFYLPFATK